MVTRLVQSIRVAENATIASCGDDAPSPRIWLVTARVGAGHVQAARAIQESLAARGLEHRVRLIDVMDHVPAYFRAAYAGGYARLASRFPRLYGAGYRLTDDDGADWPHLGETVRMHLESRMIASLRSEFDRERPDWIVHTHFLAPAIMGRWISEQSYSTRQAVVVTDFHPHRIWRAEPVDRYFVGTETGRRTLIARGVSAQDVQATGIPISARHRRPIDRTATYRHFNWPQDRPVVVLLSGSDFVIGPIAAVARRMLEAFPNVTLQAAAGRNTPLERELRQLAHHHPQLRVIGYTDRMHELLGSASLVISKTGGITTSECLAHGVPMLALFPVPGQESLNADYLVQEGAAGRADALEDVVPAARKLLGDPIGLAQCRARAASIGRPYAAEEIADHLVLSLAFLHGPVENARQGA